jgi:hypothetical protein
LNAENFAEWLRRQGYRVIRTASSYWYEISPRIYQAFPYQWVIEPQEKELTRLLCENRAIALRYSTPATAPQGKLSYHVVCEGSMYDLESLPRRASQNVRRALRYASVEPIPLSRLATEGWRLRSETLARQGRAEAESEAWWQCLCMSAEGLPGFEAWGAIHNGELASSFLAFTCDSCYTLPYLQSGTYHLKYRVNNGILYAVTHEALNRRGVSRVFAGLQSLDASADVDEFKFRMGYEPQPLRQRVVFHPWLAPFFNRASYAVAKQLLRWYPDHPDLHKAEGMLRFYVEGKRPLNKQVRPDCLAHWETEVIQEQQNSPEG